MTKHTDHCLSTSPDGGPCTCVDLCPSRRARVIAFHMKYGHPVNTTPAVPSEEQVRFRLKLIAEEFFELLEAAGMIGGAARDRVHEYIDDALPFKGLNLPEFIDALADLDHVIEGTRLVFGVDGEPIAAEVHRANMNKKALYECTDCGNQKVVHPGGAEEEQCMGCGSDDGEHHYPPDKPVKPPGWKPPDIAGELKKQGWKP